MRYRIALVVCCSSTQSAGYCQLNKRSQTAAAISSAGIHKALQSAIKAADAIANYVKGKSQALITYESQALHQFELYL
ncbi:MAG: hypothetical protein F6K55_00485 [Moorea sp. SIO4A3]|nr:hypothetical protein [Moorena sp. SIO4A3]